MSTSLVMTNDQVKLRVNSTNSFTRDELTANRDVIKLARAEKKNRLASVTGSQMGAMFDQMRNEGFELVDVKDKHSARSDYRYVVWKRDNRISPEARYEAQIAELQAEVARLKATKV